MSALVQGLIQELPEVVHFLHQEPPLNSFHSSISNLHLHKHTNFYHRDLHVLAEPPDKIRKKEAANDP